MPTDRDPQRGLSPDEVVKKALWGVERVVRRHYWIVLLVAAVLLVVNEVSLFGFDVRDWDWLFVSGFVVLFAALGLASSLPVRVQHTLDRLTNRRILVADPDILRQFSIQLHERVRRIAAVWAVVIAVAIVAAWWIAYGSAIVGRLMSIGAEVVGAVLAGLFIGRAIGYGQLGRRLASSGLRLKPEPQHFDGAAGLRPIGQLFFFQASVLAIPAAFLAVWWVVFPLYGAYDHWRDAYAALLALVVSLEVLAFVAPLVSFHRLMDRCNGELLVKADSFSREAVDLRRRLRDARPDQRDELEREIAWLSERYQAIEHMPTWPVTAQLRRRFTGENLVLLLPVLAQLLGLGEPWRQLLEGVKDWAA